MDWDKIAREAVDAHAEWMTDFHNNPPARDQLVCGGDPHRPNAVEYVAARLREIAPAQRYRGGEVMDWDKIARELASAIRESHEVFTLLPDAPPTDIEQIIAARLRDIAPAVDVEKAALEFYQEFHVTRKDDRSYVTVPDIENVLRRHLTDNAAGIAPVVDVEKLATEIWDSVITGPQEYEKGRAKIADIIRRHLTDNAAEIEKLKAERDDLRSAMDTWKNNARDAHQKIRALQVHNKRLAAERDALSESLAATTEDYNDAKAERDEAISANHSVAVCKDHTGEITGDGCLVCALAASEAREKRLREALGVLISVGDTMANVLGSFAGRNLSVENWRKQVETTAAALSDGQKGGESRREKAARFQAKCPMPPDSEEGHD